MKDGTTAYLSDSKRYYVRRMPSLENWDSIDYYTLDGEKIELAHGICSECGDELMSQMCGHYRGCSCGKSFVDTDRWFPERHRYGGSVKQI